MSLFILYVAALCSRSSPIVTQRLHPSVFLAQQQHIDYSYLHMNPGIRDTSVCYKCNILLASPSSVRSANTKASRSQQLLSDNATLNTKGRSVSRTKNRPTEDVIAKRKPSVMFDAEQFMKGHVRRVCPLCSDETSSIDTVAKIVHGVAANSRMDVISTTSCVSCLSSTTASWTRIRGFAFCCVSCDSTYGNIIPVCKNIQTFSHPAPASSSTVYYAQPIHTSTGLSYVITCSHCDSFETRSYMHN